MEQSLYLDTDQNTSINQTTVDSSTRDSDINMRESMGGGDGTPRCLEKDENGDFGGVDARNIDDVCDLTSQANYDNPSETSTSLETENIESGKIGGSDALESKKNCTSQTLSAEIVENLVSENVESVKDGEEIMMNSDIGDSRSALKTLSNDVADDTEAEKIVAADASNTDRHSYPLTTSSQNIDHVINVENVGNGKIDALNVLEGNDASVLPVLDIGDKIDNSNYVRDVEIRKDNEEIRMNIDSEKDKGTLLRESNDTTDEAIAKKIDATNTSCDRCMDFVAVGSGNNTISTLDAENAESGKFSGLVVLEDGNATSQKLGTESNIDTNFDAKNAELKDGAGIGMNDGLGEGMATLLIEYNDIVDGAETGNNKVADTSDANKCPGFVTIGYQNDTGVTSHAENVESAKTGCLESSEGKGDMCFQTMKKGKKIHNFYESENVDFREDTDEVRSHMDYEEGKERANRGQREYSGVEGKERVEKIEVANVDKEMKAVEQSEFCNFIEESKLFEFTEDELKEMEIVEDEKVDDNGDFEAADMEPGVTEDEIEADTFDSTDQRGVEQDSCTFTELSPSGENHDETDTETDTPVETEREADMDETSIASIGKRKRGKSAKAFAKARSRKRMEEDVCFICFDGGDLVLCDRRGCPKAYHPSCVNRDEAFFQAKGQWTCGWHLCSSCGKNSHYKCLTCTFSLCKRCVQYAIIMCVRGNQGFCETCLKTIMLIERSARGDEEMVQVDFDDKSSWEFLFKDYWIELKQKLSLTYEEVLEAKNPWKVPDLHRHDKVESSDALHEYHPDGADAVGSTISSSRRRRIRKQAKLDGKASNTVSTAAGNEAPTVPSNNTPNWATDELLEFVMHMRDGDKSICSQFDVQALLLEYIKRNKLRDSRHKSQIVCDSRLQNLFGKSHVGHFEMLKLLESHFLPKEDSHADEHHGSVVDADLNQVDTEGSSDALANKSKEKKSIRRKTAGRELQFNVDDFAAIDMHNIHLIYLRRCLMEELLVDEDSFHDRVVGAFVRIRISGNAQKQDLYRLVQIVGTSKTSDRYAVGKKSTNFVLEILNLSKSEVISIDTISNQEFTEDECKRLRQSIKCGLINRLTVGELQQKALALLTVRVKGALQGEITRLNHLRDRASDMGRRKELRECVEKLQLLNSPEERKRRLEEVPEIHADPNMDPNYVSEEDDNEEADRREACFKGYGPRNDFSRWRGRNSISPRRRDHYSNDSRGRARNYSSGDWGTARHPTSGDWGAIRHSTSGRDLFAREDDSIGAGEIVNESSWHGRKERWKPRIHEISKPLTPRESRKPELIQSGPHNASSRLGLPSSSTADEREKTWHYQDPSGKIQGPFSMTQLRKWSTTGYFPSDLRVWRATEKQHDSILLCNALVGNFQKDDLGRSPESNFPGGKYSASPPSTVLPGGYTDMPSSAKSVASPNPHTTIAETNARARKTRWSPSPAQRVPTAMASTEGSAFVDGSLASQVMPESEATGAVDTNNLHGSSQFCAPQQDPTLNTEQNKPYQAPNDGVPPQHGHQGSIVSEMGNPVTIPMQQAAQGNWCNESASAAPFAVPSCPFPSQAVTPPSFQGSDPYSGNVSWAVGVPANQHTAPTNCWVGPQNPNASWVGPQAIAANAYWVQSQGWMGYQPVNPGMGWVAPSPMATWVAPPNANISAGWATPVPVQGQFPTSMYQNWIQPVQGTVIPNPGNQKTNCIPHSESGGPQLPSVQREPSPAPPKDQVICRFHESGHCKKGSSCNYAHS